MSGWTETLKLTAGGICLGVAAGVFAALLAPDGPTLVIAPPLVAVLVGWGVIALGSRK